MIAACRRWGNLWAYSSAKLESRGKRMKKIVRKQSSARPAFVGTKQIKKRKARRGGTASKADKRTDPAKDFVMVKGHDNNQCRSILAKMTVREKRRLSLTAHGAARRACEQLCKLGKLDRAVTVKSEFNIPSRWAEVVPPSVPFTVEGLLKAMVVGSIQPLYDMQGKHKASQL